MIFVLLTSADWNKLFYITPRNFFFHIVRKSLWNFVWLLPAYTYSSKWPLITWNIILRNTLEWPFFLLIKVSQHILVWGIPFLYIGSNRFELNHEKPKWFLISVERRGGEYKFQETHTLKHTWTEPTVYTNYH